MLRDFRFTIRALRRQPGYSLAAVVMLGLGLAPGRWCSRLPTPCCSSCRSPIPSASWRCANGIAKRGAQGHAHRPLCRVVRGGDVLEATGAYTLAQPVLTSPDGAERLSAERLTPGVFAVLGTRPLLGRLFVTSEAAAGSEPVALLNHAFWVSRFGGDPGVIGRRLVLDGRPTTVVGVMPEGFDGPRSLGRIQLWLPLSLAAPVTPPATVMIFGRLREGVTPLAAEARLDGISRGLPGGAAWQPWCVADHRRSSL